MPEVTHEIALTNLNYTQNPGLLGYREKNNQLAINRLPSEVLSHILLAGAESDHKLWRWGSRNVQSQHIASHVCSHWRQVAINTPSLWKFIHIFGPPNEYTILCLTRAVDTLLEILIDMFPLVPYPNYPYDPVRGTKPTSEILQFLSTHGVGVRRWQSLLVRFPESDLLPIFIGFLNDNSPTSLQLIRFECADWSFHNTGSSGESILENKLHDNRQFHDKSCTLLESSVPKLRELELVSTSTPYVYFPKPVAALHTLRTLSIAPSSPYSADLTDLLLSNPQLESLYLQAGYYYSGETRLNSPDRDFIRPVVMPSLRSLHLNTVDNAQWVIHMLSTIKAPRLHDLTIQSFNQFTFGGEQRERLVSYLASGDNALDPAGNLGPVYPSIRLFNIFQFPCKKKEFMRLMYSLPQLSHLTIRNKQAEWLTEAPWLLPELELLDAPHITTEEATRLLRSRAEVGTPIKLISLQGGYMQLTSPHSEILSATRAGSSQVMPKYEHRRYDHNTEILGDWHSIRRRAEEYKKECEDRVEYDLEDDRRDELFSDDYM